jgi:hypothetical protein
MTTRLDRTLSELVKELLQPLEGLAGVETLSDLFEAVSWDASAVGITDPGAFADVVQHLTDAVDALQALTDQDDVGLFDVAKALAPLAVALVELKTLISSLNLPQGAPAGLLTELAEDIVGFLADYYLASRHPRIALVLQLLGIFSVVDIPEIKDNAGNVVRAADQRRRLNSGALSQAISDPLAYIRGRYLTDGSGNQRLADDISDLIGPDLAYGFRQLGLTSGYGYVSDDLTPDEAESAKHILIIDAPIPTGDDGPPTLLRLALSASDTASGIGLFVVVSSDLVVDLPTSAGHITGGISGALEPLIITKDSVSFADTGTTGPVQLEASVSFQSDPTATPALRLGSANGTRLEIGTVQAKLGLSSGVQPVDVSGSVDLKDSILAIQGGDGDGFLSSVLPSDGLVAKFDLGVAWSTKRGLTFHGAGGLDLTIPVGASVGGVVSVPVVHIGLRASDAGLIAEVSAAIGLSIGPIQALVDRVGITAGIAFPAGTGSLGAADLALAFKLPSGIGLAIDVAGLSGGGFIERDEVKPQYAGMLELGFYSFKLLAFGLLATVLPTGPGYSLIIMVDAEFPPVQLGFGFTLAGAGGLLGVNRTASTDALRAALTAHTLSNLLFPKSPIENAPQLLTELDTLFPSAVGRFVFGPVVRIAWGTPALLTLDLALILELPAPVRLILISELTVVLPSPDVVLVEIHLSALGTIDFGKGEGALDAVLHDSRLLSFVLHGSMALRVNWSGQKTFLLAVGGTHPKFQLPPGFPKLDRLGISLAAGSIAKLNLDGYLAISSNTLQIGAHVDLFVGVDGFGIGGYLTFDTLIQRHPFHFDGDISGAVTLSVAGDDVMALKLSASLSGPAPWHAEGSVTFDVLWWSVTKSFSATFGDVVTDLLDAVDVGKLLRDALGDARNFAASLAADVGALVSLATPTAAATTLVAHPGAGLSVHQTVVPLGLTIAQYGGAAPAGENLFNITAVSVAGVGQPAPPPVLDDFAPAQYLNLSDDERLASPSFERLAAGVELAGEFIFGAALPASSAIVRPVAYETFLVDTRDGIPRKQDAPAPPMPLGVLAAVLLDGAAGRSLLVRGGSQRYAAPRRASGPAELAFVVATSDQLATSDVGAPSGQSYSQARAALDAELAQHPERRDGLLIAPRYEAQP